MSISNDVSTKRIRNTVDVLRRRVDGAAHQPRCTHSHTGPCQAIAQWDERGQQQLYNLFQFLLPGILWHKASQTGSTTNSSTQARTGDALDKTP